MRLESLINSRWAGKELPRSVRKLLIDPLNPVDLLISSSRDRDRDKLLYRDTVIDDAKHGKCNTLASKQQPAAMLDVRSDIVNRN